MHALHIRRILALEAALTAAILIMTVQIVRSFLASELQGAELAIGSSFAALVLAAALRRYDLSASTVTRAWELGLIALTGTLVVLLAGRFAMIIIATIL